MKRIAVILMLCLLIFNWIGYQLYTALVEDQENKGFIIKLDRNEFSRADLISIKIPAVFISGYALEKREFERVDGQIEIQGNVYNYVQRRFVNDSLEVLYIPNRQINLLRSAKEDFFRQVADFQSDHSKKAGSGTRSHKNFRGEYLPDVNWSGICLFDSEISVLSNRYNYRLPQIFPRQTDQPPEIPA